MTIDELGKIYLLIFVILLCKRQGCAHPILMGIWIWIVLSWMFEKQ